MSEIEEFVKLMRTTKPKMEQMYPQELVLRFTSLVYNWNDINESLSNYMSDFMKKAVENSEYDYDKYKNLFRRTIGLIWECGDGTFLGSNGNFSPSLFEGITVGVANNIDYYERNKHSLQAKINEVKKDGEFRSYMGSAASSKNRVKKRIKRAIDILKSTE